MSNPPITASGPVVGSDQKSPVYDPEGRWCWWNISEVWLGPSYPAYKRYVPKVLDFISDFNGENYTVYVVDHLDPISLIPTLREIRPANMAFSLSETDVLFGVGPGTQSDTYRVYIDKSVMPYVMAVDVRLKVAGSMCSYCKIFRGSDLGNTGKTISAVYDSSGKYVTDNIPLEIVAIDSHVNYSIKTVTVCHTVSDLIDGEMVTAVIYSDSGHVVSKRQLLVENTSFIRSSNASLKYVSHISIETPFLSPTLDHVIDFPLNIPIKALNVVGVVHYSDGSILKLPVDGSKFKLHGLEQYLSTIVGQEVELVLSYSLSKGEVAYAGITGDGKYITEAYGLRTINPNNSYTVKLFGYPIWIDDVSGYSMKWWLFNLDRNLYFDVTSLVTYSDQTGPFNPLGFGIVQKKTVSINLHDVSGAFKPFLHTQTVEIALNSRPNELETCWTIATELLGNRPVYGTRISAKQIKPKIINISSGFTNYRDWLDNIYIKTYPIIDRTIEVNPPKPNHVIVSYGSSSVEIHVDFWDKDITFLNGIPLYSTISLRFIKRTSTGDMQLSTAMMLVR